MMRPSFSPEITFGHVLQIAAVIGSVMFAVGTVRGYIDEKFATQDQRLALHELRLDNGEVQLHQINAGDENFRTEMRIAMQQVLASIGDVKMQLATKVDIRK